MRENRHMRQPAAASLAALLTPDVMAASVEERLLWRCGRVAPPADALAEIQRLGARLDAAGWERVVTLALRNGMENLLFTHIIAAGLGPSLPEPMTRRLRERFGARTLLARRLELRQDALLAQLASVGATAIPLKGPRLARRYYGGVTLRPVHDIDLLVHAEDAPRWTEAFRATGFLPMNSRGELMGGHALRFRELQFFDASGLHIEAHLALCRLPAYHQAFRQVWSRAQPMTVNGVTALSLAPDDELRYLCMHYAAQHQGSRLIWLVDVAELLWARGDGLDWERLVEETLALRIAAPVAITLLRAQALLDAPVPRWAGERLRAAALTSPERRAWTDSQMRMTDWRRFLAQTLLLDGASERLRLLRSGGASLLRRLVHAPA